jgi:hypothetical protein
MAAPPGGKCDDTNQLVLLEHRYHEYGASAGRFGEGHGPWLAFEVGFLQSEVDDVLQLSSCGDAAKRILRAEPDHRIALPQLIPRLWGTVHGRHTERISLIQ